MTAFDLDEISRGFESPELEFKEELPSGASVARTACAFANGRGGKLVLGVRDEDREIVGVDPGAIQDLEEQISSMVHDSVEPQIVPQYTTVRREGKTLLVVHIPPGSLTPYYLASEGKEEGTYIRVGSQTRTADAATIQELELRRRNMSFDQMPFREAKPDTLSEERIQGFIQQRHEVRDAPIVEATEEFLTQFGILAREGAATYPTVGGLLLFTESPQKWFPYARVKCARFRGTSVGEYIDQKDIEGPLPEQIEGALKFFKSNTPRGAKIEGVYREEKNAYPEVAVREAIANAVCHRAYHNEGSDIKLAIFDDRIEITSPGGLPGQVTVDQLGTGVSHVRNRVIGRVFREMGIIEEFGQGTTRMREAMDAWGLAPPVFDDLGGAFKVTLPQQPSPQPEALDEETRKLLATVRERGRLTTQEGAEVIDRSKRTVQRKLKTLQEEGLVRWQGRSATDPEGFYEPA